MFRYSTVDIDTEVGNVLNKESMEGTDHCKITSHVDKLLDHNKLWMKVTPNI